MVNLFLFGSFVCPGVFLIGGILMLANFAKKDRLSYLWVSIPIGVAVLFTIMFFFTVIYDTSGLLSFIQKGSLVIALILSFLTAITQGVQQKQNFGRNTLAFYSIGSLLILISSGVGLLSSRIIVNRCETFHVEIGNVVVNSLEKFYFDKKEYPNSLSDLIPQYLHGNTIKTCFSPRLKLDSLAQSDLEGFYYKKCSSGITQLSIPEMGTGHFHIYDLESKKWFTSRGDTLEEWGRVTLCQP